MSWWNRARPLTLCVNPEIARSGHASWTGFVLLRCQGPPWKGHSSRLRRAVDSRFRYQRNRDFLVGVPQYSARSGFDEMHLSASRTIERFVELIRAGDVFRSRNTRLNVKSGLRASDDQESRR